MAILSILFVLTIAFFSLNYGLAQKDLQELQSSSSLSSQTTTGPGMLINNSLVSNTTTVATDSATLSPIQGRVTIGSFGDDRIIGSNDTDIIIGLLGADTV